MLYSIIYVYSHHFLENKIEKLERMVENREHKARGIERIKIT